MCYAQGNQPSATSAPLRVDQEAAVPPLDAHAHTRIRLEFEVSGCQSLAHRRHRDRMKRRRFEKMLLCVGITAPPLIGVRVHSLQLILVRVVRIKERGRRFHQASEYLATRQRNW